MEEKELIKMLAEGENEFVEFKRKITPKVAEEIVAMSNARGGIIIIGVDDEGRIVGTTSNKESINALVQNITPPPNLKIEETSIGEKKILIIKVEKTPYITTLGGVAYIRIGSSKRPLSLEETMALANEYLIFSFDRSLTPAGEKEVDLRIVEKLKEKVKRVQWKKWLYKQGYAKNNHLTLAGLLIFGKEPTAYFPHAKIRIKTGALEQKVEGPLPFQVEKSVAYITANLPQLEIKSGVRRTEMWGEEIALMMRELVVNALVHRNYAIYSEVFVECSGSKIIIKNPGSFPPGFNIEDPQPLPRNPLIYEGMHLLGYVEKEGGGIEEVRRIARKYGIKVRWISKEVFTVVEVEFPTEVDEKDREILAIVEVPSSSSSIAKKIRLSKVATVERLKRLEEKGLVKRIGKGRFVKWVKS